MAREHEREHVQLQEGLKFYWTIKMWLSIYSAIQTDWSWAQEAMLLHQEDKEEINKSDLSHIFLEMKWMFLPTDIQTHTTLKDIAQLATTTHKWSSAIL